METEFNEHIFVEGQLNKHGNMLVGFLYRSPSIQNEEMNVRLRILTTEAVGKRFTHIMMMGDFNHPGNKLGFMDKWGRNAHTKKHIFLKCIQNNYIFQQRKSRQCGEEKTHFTYKIYFLQMRRIRYQAWNSKVH